MQILNSPEDIRSLCGQWRDQGHRVALVPTMGYYHAGHESLMRYAREKADRVVVSLFVNPAQFGPGEDLAAYPRDLERDAATARSLGVDALFHPAPEAMYAPDHATWVNVPDLARGLCGVSRPTHFQGVCTVVLKLFLLTLPHLAVFGEKDWQQLAIIKRMVRDLNVPVYVEGRPIVREADGLAMSSRNVYLSAEERAQAPEIQRGLQWARELVRQGETNAALLRDAVLLRWAERLPLGRLDYLSVVDPVSLEPLDVINGPSLKGTTLTGSALMACAVRVGKARLLDNILL